MTWKTSTWLRAGEWLLNKRWWLVALTSLSVFTFEFIEYQPFLNGIPSSFFIEILFYGIVLPLSTGVALSWAAASRTELAWSAYSQGLIHNLGIQLHNAHSHNELAAVLLQFVKVVMPLAGATVYKYDQQSHTYKTILSWSLNKDLSFSDSISECKAQGCPCLNYTSKDDVMFLHPCQDSKIIASSRTSTCYCLPFLFSNFPVGGARFYLSSRRIPSPEQERLMKEIAPLIASVLQRVQLERLMKKQNDSFSAEQLRIARDVHDTLGHSLAYLRLRLDQISMEFNRNGMNNTKQEVEALRDVAKEAYDQMRNVLTTLAPDHASNLNNTLLDFVDRINRRGPLRLRMHHEGQPRTLSSSVQRNIFYIFQEILTNVEKHARAQQVDINLNWQQTSLEVDVADDGVGFDPTLSIPGGHFGLSNMRERALENGFQVSISSQPGQGTRITLHVPYEVENESVTC